MFQQSYKSEAWQDKKTALYFNRLMLLWLWNKYNSLEVIWTDNAQQILWSCEV